MLGFQAGTQKLQPQSAQFSREHNKHRDLWNNRMYAIASQTSSVFKISVFLIAFGVVSMLIAALTIINQVNLKKVIAYSTVEHMGFLLVGLGLGTPLAIFWALFYVLAHGFTKASLFLSAGILHHQFKGVRMNTSKTPSNCNPSHLGASFWAL